ncbi:MAG: Rne/Rng family ribonuclease [Phycisphaerae bacterium]
MSEFARGLADEVPTAAADRGERATEELVEAESQSNGESGAAQNAESGAAGGRRRRRGRRGGRKHRRRRGGAMEGAAADSAAAVEEADDSIDAEESPAVTRSEPVELPHGLDEVEIEESAATSEPRAAETAGEGSGRGGRRRGRGRRGGRSRRRRGSTESTTAGATAEVAPAESMAEAEPEPVYEPFDDEEPEEEAVELRPVGEVSDPKREPIRDGREVLINVADDDECRIAIMRAGRLDELYIERVSAASHVGNIYKGRVTNVEPSIQAAFVDFGLSVHGFLHISDLHPKYFPNGANETEQVGRKTPRRERPPIQRCLRRGQEVIVQITKEGIGTKGPTLTSYISVPGRFLVMMPDMNQLGVSRKIEDDETRRELREVLSQLTLPGNMGFIMRTAAIGRSKRDLQRDLSYLTRLWRSVEERIRQERAPCELYQESDLVIRTIRDVFDADVKRILSDHLPTAQRVGEFLAIASPKSRDCVRHYTGHEPLFHLYSIEAEIEKLHNKHVPLPCGGSLVIEPTEALVAIDVNSGRFRVPDDPEETAYRVNLEAADEIARQLMLRDLGGLIICDFIDMRAEKHKRTVERRLRDALKHHKERAKILKMSKFGIIEMTRQRQRPSISSSVYAQCTRCRGTGKVKTAESVSLEVMRMVKVAGHLDQVAIVDVQVSPAVANHLLNRRRRALAELEHESGRTIMIRGVESFGVDEVRYSCTDRRGREVPFTDVHAVPVTGGRGGGPAAGGASGGGSRGPRGRWSGARSEGA